MKTRLLSIFALLFAPAICSAQYAWPTYPVNAPIGIYKAMVDDGTGIAVQAVGDTEFFAGITQAAVVTSHGTVPLAVDGASQIQVGASPVTLGELVTSDSNGNATGFAPAQDGQLHCALGSVVAGNTAPGGYIYIRIVTTCLETNGGGSGAVDSVFGRTGVVIAVSGDYSVGQVTGAAPLASPALTGTPTVPTATVGTSTTQAASTAFVLGQGFITAAEESVSSVFGRTGAVVATTGDYSVGQVTGAAPLASPALTGTPTAPTGTGSSTQIATQAFVLGQGFITSAPVSSVFGRTGAVIAVSGDYSVGQVTGAAPLASPALTGTPTVPTATVGTSTTQAASTAFVLGQGFLTSSTGANIGLSNLGSVAINTALLPGITNSIALGSTSLRFSNLFSTAINCGIPSTTSCVFTGQGATSGTATITWPSVAGTATNPFVFSNDISFSAGQGIIFPGSSSGTVTVTANSNGGAIVFSSSLGATTLLSSSGLNLDGSGSAAIQVANPIALNKDTTITGAMTSTTIKSTTNCSSGASPAVCGASRAGSVAIPTGATSTLVVDTTAVTATSEIILTVDSSATISGTTCNTTLATLVGGYVVTARTAATSFTISAGAAITTNPVCISYTITN